MVSLRNIVKQPLPQRRKVFEIAHIGVPRNVATLNPSPRSGPPPTHGGFPIGRVLADNSPFILNPYELHANNYIGGMSILFLGDRGSGKTNGLYTLGSNTSRLRNRATGKRMRVSVEDTRLNVNQYGIPEPEYKNLVEGILGGEHINLLDSKINFLDPQLKLNPEQQVQLLESLFEVVKAGDLTPNERAAINVGIVVMRKQAPKSASLLVLQQILSRLSLEDYVNYQNEKRDTIMKMIDDHDEKRNMSTRLDQVINVISANIRDGAHTVSQLTDALLSGYDGIFGAEHQIYEILTQPVVGMDMTRLSPDTIPMVEMVLSAIRTGSGAQDLGADLEIRDEDTFRWESLPYATHTVTHLKKIRARSVMIARGIHRVSDVDQITGAAQRAKATTALSETDILFVGKMQRSQHERLQSTFRPIPQSLLDRLPGLRPGEFLVLIGESWPPFLVKFDLTRRVRMAAYTDYARDLKSGAESLN